MLITFDIDDAQWPTVRAAILNVHPKPTDPDDPRYVEDETDLAWVHRVLRRRFRTDLMRCMKMTDRGGLTEPNPGLRGL